MKNYHILILILDYGERFLKVAIELYKVQSSLDELKSKKTIILSKNYWEGNRRVGLSYFECFGTYARRGNVIFTQINPFQIRYPIECFIWDSSDAVSWDRRQEKSLSYEIQSAPEVCNIAPRKYIQKTALWTVILHRYINLSI